MRVKNSNSRSTKKDKSIQGISKKKKASKCSVSIQTCKYSLGIQQEAINNFGNCPICMDKLGEPEKLLASTKCGHIFCLQCLRRSLLVNKTCPTCRRSLRGKYAYHPLYFNNN